MCIRFVNIFVNGKIRTLPPGSPRYHPLKLACPGWRHDQLAPYPMDRSLVIVVYEHLPASLDLPDLDGLGLVAEGGGVGEGRHGAAI